MGVLFSDNVKCNNCIESVIDEWASMDQWWNNTDKGKTNILREKSVIDECEYGPVMEQYWQGKTNILREKSVIDDWASMDQWRNSTDKGKTNTLREKSVIDEWASMDQWRNSTDKG
jgi:hypothetical protein